MWKCLSNISQRFPSTDTQRAIKFRIAFPTPKLCKKLRRKTANELLNEETTNKLDSQIKSRCLISFWTLKDITGAERKSFSIIIHTKFYLWMLKLNFCALKQTTERNKNCFSLTQTQTYVPWKARWFSVLNQPWQVNEMFMSLISCWGSIK